MDAVAGPTADRQVRRTRALLHRALFELIVEQGYDRTTVQDIIDRADVGRSTFYTHYPTKDDLLLSGLDDLRDVLERTVDTGTPGPDSRQPLLAPLRPVFDHAEGNRQLFRAMLGGRAASVARRAGRRMLSDTLAGHLRTHLTVDDQDDLDIAVTFLVDGLVGVLVWWLDTHPHLPAEEIYTRFESLATQGLRSFVTDR